MLWVYTPVLTKRHLYIFRELLEDRLGLSIQVTTHLDAFRSIDKPKLIYAPKCPDQEASDLWIWASDYLMEEGVFEQKILPGKWEDLPTLYHEAPTHSATPFDIFAASFYLLSRQEEYQSKGRDIHGRFQAKHSIAFKQQFLQIPIVDLWIQALGKMIQSIYPSIQLNPSPFRQQPTYDIDYAWAFRSKGLTRSLAGLSKDLLEGRWQRIRDRFKSIESRSKDPFHCYEWLDDLHQRKGLTPLYFFLVGSYGPYDKNANPNARVFQELIQSIAHQYIVGLHPSYRSNGDQTVLKEEFQMLEQIIGPPLVHSRQHYLKVHLPDTYQHLIDVGIKQDYSMGYAEAIGFRAGTCKSFKWYDLSQEKETDLTVHPFCLMDVTLKDYLKYTPEEALAQAQLLRTTIQQVGGTFSTIWHNSSFYAVDGWGGWKEIYATLWED